MTTIHVRLFARAKDLAGAERVAVEVPTQARVGDLRRCLAERYPALARLLERSALAVDNEFADDAQLISATAEVALLPPVSGG
jgi:molybdopterin converting factor subunit 1